MTLSRRARSLKALLACAGLLSCIPVAAAEALLEAHAPVDQPQLHSGVSTVLDSPSPYAYRQITPFVLQNFGITEAEDLGTPKDDTEEEIPLWNIREKFKRATKETKRLADALAYTPKQDQFAIASKLTEYDSSFDPLNPPDAHHQNIVSVDLLRELQFLNADHQSILKAISRTATKGGDLAITALVSKCSDNIDVIKSRRDFIKFLIENPMVLETLRDHLGVIRDSEPLLFSNYRSFKQERLKGIVKGGLIKAFIKKQFASRPDAEQIATQAELIYKPVFSFLASIVTGSLGAVDFIKALRSNGKQLSSFGMYSQIGIDFFKGVPLLNVPHKIIKAFSERRAWRSFLHDKIAYPGGGETNSFQDIANQHQTHEGAVLLAVAGKTILKKTWFSGNFWDSQKAAFDEHYSHPAPSAAGGTPNIFNKLDPDKNIVREILTAEILQQQIDQGIQLNHPSQDPFAKTPGTGVPSPTAPTPRSNAKAMINTGGATFHPITDEELMGKAERLLEIEYTPAERNKIYNWLALVGLIAGAAFVLPTLEMSYKDYMANYLDLKNLFDSVQSPYKIYQAAKSMHSLLGAFPETHHLYPALIPSTSKHWNHFLKLVTSRTFQRSFGPFDFEFVRKNHGEVVQAYECLTRSQAEIGELIRFYGELDAYTSMALLVKEFERTNNSQCVPVRYSFVEFIENSTYPRFEAEHYWNPMFKPERVVPNRINLGENGLARNVIVTGANAGGKSGNIKAALIGIILAQTFGVCPAQNLKMTIFTNILATLKSNDDTANNKSRFQVEAYEMAKVIERILTTPSDKFTIFFSDEPFAGTEVGPAIALLRRIFLSIAKMDNVMSFSTTHYKELTKLEVLTNGVFKNFKVEVIKLPDGSLFRPYLLLEGIGGTNIAFDVFLEQLSEIGMKSDFLYDMVQQAKLDQQHSDLINPIRTLGRDVMFADRKDQ